MPVTSPVHRAKALMDAWRTTTPRLLCDVVHTHTSRDVNGNTVFSATIGMVRVTEQRDYSLTDAENYLNVSMQALEQYSSTFQWALLDYRLSENAGVFVFQRTDY